jgi:hypothetical protein
LVSTHPGPVPRAGRTKQVLGESAAGEERAWPAHTPEPVRRKCTAAGKPVVSLHIWASGRHDGRMSGLGIVAAIVSLLLAVSIFFPAVATRRPRGAVRGTTGSPSANVVPMVFAYVIAVAILGVGLYVMLSSTATAAAQKWAAAALGSLLVSALAIISKKSAGAAGIDDHSATPPH